MLNRVLAAIVLPQEITPFERHYLARMTKVAMVFLLLHLPVFMLIAWLNQTNPLQALALTLLVLAGPFLATRALSNPRHISLVFGITAMLMGGLLVHFGRGLWTIEMHFYFFAALALLTVFGNPAVILVAALTVTLHHLIFWFIQPVSVFNYDAPITSVLVHAAFVVVESVAACFVARSFFDNVIGLDKIVQQRTQEVDARNQDMRLVLDNVGQGLFTMNLDGTMSGERSSILAEWLGPSRPGQTFWEHLAVHDGEFSAQFCIGWEAILEDILPLPLLLDQLPSTLELPDRTLRLDYTPIMETPAKIALHKLLVVISDITAQLHREQAELERQEMMTVFEKVVNHRSAFAEFLEESERLVGFLLDSDGSTLPIIRRQVHTLKGNCSIYGLRGLSRLCHDIETRMCELGEGITGADKRKLQNHWHSLSEKTDRFLKWKSHPRIELEEGEVVEFRQRVASGLARPMIVQTISNWTLQPTQVKLEHFGEQARHLARCLGKVEVRVEIESNRLRLAAGPWKVFWTNFAHVVRNAVDHGFETVEERRRANKAEPAVLTLRTFTEAQSFVVEIHDDGRGIDWEAVKARAVQMGIPVETPGQLVEALFVDTLTTRDEVTEYSGRGVGLGAVRQACAALRGEVQVETQPGMGTTFRFSFPLAAMGQAQETATLAARAERGR
ncbi:Hpt domain-containing protein [bacterium]|nr:Hpt domain-containing protein [bacterium]